MIPIALIVKFVETNWKYVVAAIVIAPTLFLLGQCSGRSIERNAQDKARLEANAKAQAVDAKAQENASGDRVVDAVRNAESKKELYDEIAKVPDSVPGPARIQLGCQRLRNAGRSEADLPGVCRPASGHGSEAAPR